MAAGRPTIYNEEILTKTEEYIISCEGGYEVQTRPKIVDGIHKGEEDYSKIVAKVPTIEGLAYYLGINKDTIYTWRKEKPEFSELIERLLAKQANELINKALTGDYNPVIAKVLLTKHGYREGTDITTNDKDLNPKGNDKEVVEKALKNL